VESLSALVEDQAGQLRLVTWQEIVKHRKLAVDVEVDDGELCVSPS